MANERTLVVLGAADPEMAAIAQLAEAAGARVYQARVGNRPVRPGELVDTQGIDWIYNEMIDARATRVLLVELHGKGSTPPENKGAWVIETYAIADNWPVSIIEIDHHDPEPDLAARDAAVGAELDRTGGEGARGAARRAPEVDRRARSRSPRRPSAGARAGQARRGADDLRLRGVAPVRRGPARDVRRAGAGHRQPRLRDRRPAERGRRGRLGEHLGSCPPTRRRPGRPGALPPPGPPVGPGARRAPGAVGDPPEGRGARVEAPVRHVGPGSRSSWPSPLGCPGCSGASSPRTRRTGSPSGASPAGR
jgi:hypothetical protein